MDIFLMLKKYFNKKYTRSTRYDFLLEIVEYLKPTSIIEVGVAKGKNAEKMLKLLDSKLTKYTGYDVFEFSDKAFHKMVGNGKMVLSEQEIFTKLSRYSSNITLVKGKTEDTLWGTNQVADLVWLDGDHRVEAIQKDFNALKKSKIIVFDDYYTEQHSEFPIDEFGCNKVVQDLENIIITPKTTRFGHIRLAIYSEDKQLLSEIGKALALNSV